MGRARLKKRTRHSFVAFERQSLAVVLGHVRKQLSVVHGSFTMSERECRPNGVVRCDVRWCELGQSRRLEAAKARTPGSGRRARDDGGRHLVIGRERGSINGTPRGLRVQAGAAALTEAARAEVGVETGRAFVHGHRCANEVDVPRTRIHSFGQVRRGMSFHHEPVSRRSSSTIAYCDSSRPFSAGASAERE